MACRDIAVLAGALAVAGGVAQGDETLTLDEIIIWGPARDARALGETAAGVGLVDRDEIARRQPATYEDLLGDLPGVTIGGGPRGVAQEPNIRGFTDDQIVIRVDGARQNFDLAHRGRFFADPDSLKQVEVVRGGASTLYGSGALGGVILLDTIDAADLVGPDEVWGGRAKLGFNSQGAQVLASTALAAQAGGFDALGFLSYRPMGRDLTDGSGDDIANTQIDAANALAKLGHTFAPGNRVEASYQRYQDAGLTPPNANDVGTPANVVDRDLTYQTARLAWDYAPDGDWLDLSALAYVNDTAAREDRVADGRRDTTDFTTFGFDLVNRSRVDLGLPVRLSYGIEGYQDDQTARRNGAPRDQAPDATRRVLAGFVQGDVALTPDLTLTPGLRLDYFDLAPEGDFPDRRESELSPRVALSWSPTPTSQVWINAAQSFRAPSLTELYNDGVHFATPGFGLGPGTVFTGTNVFVPTPDLRPEVARQIELGGRLELPDLVTPGDSLRLSANGYFARVDDFIDTVVQFIDFGTGTFNPATGNFEVNGSTTNVNVDAVLWGWEGEVAYDARDWFAGAGLTIPRGANRDGGDLGSIPQVRLVLTGGWRPVPQGEVGLRVTLADGQDDAPAGGVVTPGYTTLDVFARWSPDHGPLAGTHFAAGIDNLTDQTYRIHPNGLNQSGIAFKVSAALDF